MGVVSPPKREPAYDSCVQDPHLVCAGSGVVNSLTATDAVPDLHQDMRTLFQDDLIWSVTLELSKQLLSFSFASNEECPKAWVDKFIFEDASNLFQDEGFHFADILEYLFTTTLPPYLTFNFDVFQQAPNARTLRLAC